MSNAEATIARPEVKRRGLSPKALRETLDAYGMLLPTILGVVVFFAVPLGISLYLSFTNAKLIGGTTSFVGLDNYVNVLKDTTFHQALRQTFIFSFGAMVLSILPALALATILNEKLRGLAFFRSLYFIPVVASVVAVSLLWKYLLNFDFGFLNYVLFSIGLSRVEWLTSGQDFLGVPIPLWACIFVFSWKTVGYNMVIFLAGMQGIPRPLYEASGIDGASRWQQFSKITVPMLSPTTFFVLVTTLINCLQAFDVPFALGWTRSNTAGPIDSMLTVVINLYREGFIGFRMGYASAMAWLLTAMILVITVVQFRMSSRWVNYE